MKDLFEDYENQPVELSNLLTKFGEEFDGDGHDYKDLARLVGECEEIGYTFDYSLDAEPYGLRPIGVKLNELEGCENA